MKGVLSGCMTVLLASMLSAAPLTLRQYASTTDSDIRVAWSGTGAGLIGFVYRSDLDWEGLEVGRTGYLWGVTGGIAIYSPQGAPGRGSGFVHSMYGCDYAAGHTAVQEIYADGVLVFRATSNTSSGWTGQLATQNATLQATEVNMVLTGRLAGVDADVRIEHIVRDDAPRLMLGHMLMKYTKTISVSTLYHQTLHTGNTPLMAGTLGYLTCNAQGAIHQGSALPSSMLNGLFFTMDTTRYIGFLAPHDCDEFVANPSSTDYYALYKRLCSGVTRNAGDSADSYCVSTWGTSLARARQLLTWTDAVRQNSIPSPATDEDRANVAMIVRAFYPDRTTGVDNQVRPAAGKGPAMQIRPLPGLSSRRRCEIRLQMPEGSPAGAASVAICGARGELVRTLHSGPQSAGVTTLVWDGCDRSGCTAARGLYVVRVETAEGRTCAGVVALR